MLPTSQIYIRSFIDTADERVTINVRHIERKRTDLNILLFQN